MLQLKICSGTVVGLLSRFPPFRSFPNFSALSKHTLDIEYHVYIWQVSPQLSCGDTCQIWKWFKESNRYFCKIENFANGEINERSFSNPHPSSVQANFTEYAYIDFMNMTSTDRRIWTLWRCDIHCRLNWNLIW